MHDLIPTPALGIAAQTIGTITISEHPGVALASVAARMGQETACRAGLKTILAGEAPGPGHYHFGDPISGFWMGPDQWMLGTSLADGEDIAERVKAKLGDCASVTEQSGGWVVFDVKGNAILDMFERLCAAPVRQMKAGDAQRTMIHQLGCFVIPRADPDHIYVIGPRASAGSLHHALVAAAHSVA